MLTFVGSVAGRVRYAVFDEARRVADGISKKGALPPIKVGNGKPVRFRSSITAWLCREACLVDAPRQRNQFSERAPNDLQTSGYELSGSSSTFYELVATAVMLAQAPRPWRLWRSASLS